MKSLSLFNKIIFIFNIFVALLLLLASMAAFIDLGKYSFLIFLSLTVPALEIINLFFIIYWIILKKKQFLLSLVIILIAYVSMGSFYMINTTENKDVNNDLKVMSFNVRGFNRTGQIKKTGVFEDIQNLINNENPEVICFQEFDFLRRKEFDNYPYRQLKSSYEKGKAFVAIYSKFPIVNSGSIDFINSANGASFADIVVKKDTIRIYNIHLESLRLPHHADGITNELSDGLFERLSDSFQKQIEQAEIFKEHNSKNTYRTIVCGDFNNTQFSKAYHMIKEDMNDSYIEKGNGFGKTYNFLHFPLRIDYIMADSSFEILTHTNFKERLSDHYPIIASFRLKRD